MNWLDSATHRSWLRRHTLDLLEFGRETAHPEGGARWLDARGAPVPGRPTYTWITCRMAHVYGIGALLGVPGAGPIAERAMAGLTGPLHDEVHDGWFPAVHQDGTAEPGKSCYDHAFVLLAASTTLQAGLPGTREFFAHAERVFLERFYDDATGLCVDTWNSDFTELDDYRGLNANMHAVEAMLTAASVTGRSEWIDRATRICAFVVDTAKVHDWRIPEHFGGDWSPRLDLNRDQPDHPFKPFGATVGHALEWSRLFLHAEAARPHQGDDRLVEAAVALFHQAVADGWQVDGHPGFVYTTDWAGVPVVHDRMHWVVAEAISAAAALYHRTQEAEYADWYRAWWDYADTFLLDHRQGSWIHQLDAANNPDDKVWSGKPDTYHAFQAALVPRLPLYPMAPTAILETRTA